MDGPPGDRSFCSAPSRVNHTTGTVSRICEIYGTAVRDINSQNNPPDVRHQSIAILGQCRWRLACNDCDVSSVNLISSAQETAVESEIGHGFQVPLRQIFHGRLTFSCGIDVRVPKNESVSELRQRLKSGEGHPMIHHRIPMTPPRCVCILFQKAGPSSGFQSWLEEESLSAARWFRRAFCKLT